MQSETLIHLQHVRASLGLAHAELTSRIDEVQRPANTRHQEVSNWIFEIQKVHMDASLLTDDNDVRDRS